MDDLLLVDVEHLVLVDGAARSLAVELEDHHTGVMGGTKEVDVGVGGDEPEAVVLALELLDGDALVEVPDTQGLVLTGGEDEVLVWVEDDTVDVVGVAPAGVDLPGLGGAHSPDLDLAVVATGDDEGQGGVEGGPVDTAGVTLEDELDEVVAVAAVHEVLLGDHLVLDGHGAGGGVLLSEARDVPDADGLVERGRDNQVLGGVELGAHDEVVVAGETRDLLAVLPVPDPDGLVVGGSDEPWQLVVEEHGTDVVHVAGEGVQTLVGVQRPDLYSGVVAGGGEDGLGGVEVNTADRALVALKTVQQGAHSVVPQLDGRGEERDQHPGSRGVERDTLGPGGLGLELG